MRGISTEPDVAIACGYQEQAALDLLSDDPRDRAALYALKALADLCRACGHDAEEITLSLGRAAAMLSEGSGAVWESDLLREVSEWFDRAAELAEQEARHGGALFEVEGEEEERLAA